MAACASPQGAGNLLRRVRPARRAWPEGFAMAALVFLAIPIADAITTSRGLPGSLLAGDSLFAAFDLAMLAIALLLGVASWRAGKPPRQVPRRTRQAETIHA